MPRPKPPPAPRKLPPGVHYKHGAFYFVRNNKWHPLGRDYRAALLAYAQRVAADLPDASTASARQVSVQKLVELARPSITRDKSPETVRAYVRALEVIAAAFQEFDVAEVKPRHIAAAVDAWSAHRVAANLRLTVLRLLFDYALRAQMIDSNPAAAVKPARVRARDRLISADEFARIQQHAPDVLRVAIRLAAVLGQRVGDLLALRWGQVCDQHIEITQQKTRKKLRIVITDDVRRVLGEARALYPDAEPGPGCFVLRNRAHQGAPVSASSLRAAWRAACAAAGVDGAHFHDLRALALTNLDARGGDAQALAGHSTQATTRRYLRDKSAPVVRPAPLPDGPSLDTTPTLRR